MFKKGEGVQKYPKKTVHVVSQNRIKLQSNVKTFDFQIFQNGQNPAGKLDFLKFFQ